MFDFHLLQLADSAFPAGGFAHSNGLEALHQAGALDRRSLEVVSRDVIEQAASFALPLAGAAFDQPDRLAELDALAGSYLWSAVAARASRAQGRALLDAAARILDSASLRAAKAALRGRAPDGAPSLEGHFAPVFGLVGLAMGLDRRGTLATLLFTTHRGALSAAVRLGVVGPFEAQALQHRQRALLEAALARGEATPLEDLAQTAPLLELFGATHDRLYSRLFQS
ncbi:MAG: urease accessory UreF family protein [Polyangiaceae bacterium]